MTIYNEPAPWPGTPEEAERNRRNHHYTTLDGETRCMDCDYRPSYVSATWPCGSTVPRRVTCTDCTRGIKHEHDEYEAAMLRGSSD